MLIILSDLSQLIPQDRLDRLARKEDSHPEVLLSLSHINHGETQNTLLTRARKTTEIVLSEDPCPWWVTQ